MFYVIKGPAKSGKSYLGNALRNSAVTLRRAALLLDDANADADPQALVEKLLDGAFVPGKEGAPADVDAQPWKKTDAFVVVAVGDVGDRKAAEIEALLPGFIKKFGPTAIVTTELAK